MWLNSQRLQKRLDWTSYFYLFILFYFILYLLILLRFLTFLLFFSFRSWFYCYCIVSGLLIWFGESLFNNNNNVDEDDEENAFI